MEVFETSWVPQASLDLASGGEVHSSSGLLGEMAHYDSPAFESADPRQNLEFNANTVISQGSDSYVMQHALDPTLTLLLSPVVESNGYVPSILGPFDDQPSIGGGDGREIQSTAAIGELAFPGPETDIWGTPVDSFGFSTDDEFSREVYETINADGSMAGNA